MKGCRLQVRKSRFYMISCLPCASVGGEPSVLSWTSALQWCVEVIVILPNKAKTLPWQCENCGPCRKLGTLYLTLLPHHATLTLHWCISVQHPTFVLLESGHSMWTSYPCHPQTSELGNNPCRCRSSLVELCPCLDHFCPCYRRAPWASLYWQIWA